MTHGSMDALVGDAPRARHVRSAGILSADQVAAFRKAGVPLAYDPVLIGWVPADTDDDLGSDGGYRPWPVARGAAEAHVTLRPWSEAEASRYAALLGDARVWLFLPEPQPHPLTADLARDLIRVANNAPHHRVRAAEVDGVAVGQVRLHLTAPGAAPGEAEISYWLGADHWGRGIASAMVRQFTADGFAALSDLRAVFARVHKHNTASARVLLKAGYAAACACPRDPNWRLFRVARR